MKIEDITPELIAMESDAEIMNLHFRLHQIYDVVDKKHFPFTREDVIINHTLIMDEYDRRDFSHTDCSELDNVANEFSNITRGLPINISRSKKSAVVSKGHVAILSADEDGTVNILIRSDSRQKGVEMVVVDALGLTRSDSVRFLYSEDGVDGKQFPIFDLKLVRGGSGSVVSGGKVSGTMVEFAKSALLNREKIDVGFIPPVVKYRYPVENYDLDEIFSKWDDGAKIYALKRYGGLRSLIGKVDDKPFIIYEDTKGNRIDAYPESVAKIVNALPEGTVLDAEIFIEGNGKPIDASENIQRLVSGVNLGDSEKVAIKITDIPKKRGQSLVGKDYDAREKQLSGLFADVSFPEAGDVVFKASQSKVVKDKEQAKSFIDEVLGEVDGAVLFKPAKSKYSEDGFSEDWVEVFASNVGTLQEVEEKAKDSEDVNVKEEERTAEGETPEKKSEGEDMERSYLNFKGKPTALYSDDAYPTIVEKIMEAPTVIEVFDSGGDITYDIWGRGYKGKVGMVVRNENMRRLYTLAKDVDVAKLETMLNEGKLPTAVEKGIVADWNEKTFSDPESEFYRMFYMNKAVAYTSFPGYKVDPDSVREGRAVVPEKVLNFVKFAHDLEIYDNIPDSDGIFWINVPAKDYRRRLSINASLVRDVVDKLKSKDAIIVIDGEFASESGVDSAGLDLLRQYRDVSFAGQSLNVYVTKSLGSKMGVKKAEKSMRSLKRSASIFPSSNHFVLAPVLVPYYVDEYGTWLKPEDIEDVAHRYMEMRNAGIEHQEFTSEASLAESYITRSDIEFEVNGEKEKFPKGTWIVGFSVSDELYDKIERGEFSGVSIGGLEIL